MDKLRVWILLLLVSGWVSVTDARAQNWVARHDMTSVTYQREFDKWTRRGYRPVDVSGYTKSGSPRFAALWEKKSGPRWVARHNLSSTAYQREFDKWTRKGYRLVDVSGYVVRNRPRFAAIWEKRSGPAWVARHNLTSTSYQREFDKWTRRGYRLVHVSGYSPGGRPRFAAIWQKRSGPAWVARHNLTSTSYQREFDKRLRQGYRLVHVSGYQARGKAAYAAIWQKSGGSRWVARHGMSSGNYQSAFDNQRYAGFRPVRVSGFTVRNQPRFAAIWQGSGLKAADQERIDRTVESFMRKYEVPGLALAIAHKGRLVYAGGFGHADKEAGLRTSPLHRFRIASVSKPITSVAVMKLVEQGRLRLTDKVFGRGGILGTKYGKKPYKPGITSITVQHLLEHTAGGWPNDRSDPMFKKKKYDHRQLISWVLDTYDLEKRPGTAHDYSNFGYAVLGRVIEEKTGKSYSSYVRQAVLAPAGITGMTIGGDTKAQRRRGEVVYYGQDGQNPYNMKVARMDAHGGWIASPVDLVRLAVRVDGFPTKPDLLKARTVRTMTTASSANRRYAKGWSVNASKNWWHGGSLPGTRSILVRTNHGYNWAVVVNTRNTDKSFSRDLDKLTWSIVDGVDKWPGHDLF